MLFDNLIGKKKGTDIQIAPMGSKQTSNYFAHTQGGTYRDNSSGTVVFFTSTRIL